MNFTTGEMVPGEKQSGGRGNPAWFRVRKTLKVK